jgi:L-ascorbate metabolism protein UlaG (beta-lactamase superfamily)
MKLTKYEHACITLEQDSAVLVVDPGGLSPDFVAPEGVVAVVITHQHGDHFDHDVLASIIDKNPEAIVIAPADVVSQIEVFETRQVTGGDSVSVGPFDLTFYGEKHAPIHASLPVADNVGVLINNLAYYPGDSFTLPEGSVDTLAVPASGPWLKVGESIDFLLAVKPRFAFPTHEGLLNDDGKAFTYAHLQRFAESINAEFRSIQGETIDV